MALSLAFGPVPSRRLGYSLGINHIPQKHCPYACVYCQAGRTTRLEAERCEFYTVDTVIRDVEQSVAKCRMYDQVIDYLSLVPDGEPTLDIHLEELIDRLKQFGLPIAVISNAALIDRPDVQKALFQADWVSVKVDAIDETAWRKINRPYARLSLPAILRGIAEFRSRFHGEFVTETMLVSGINDRDEDIERLCDFLLELQPFKAYLSIPTRPPAESWVRPPAPESLKRILKTVSERVAFLDLLLGPEDMDFSSTGNLADDICNISAVHPIREEALRRMVAQAGAEWSVIESLVISGKIARIQYRDEVFYVRCFPDKSCNLKE